MKPQDIRLQLTLSKEPRAVAFILQILRNLYDGDAKKVIRTVAAYYGMTVIG